LKAAALRALSAGELLATWEWGLARGPLERGIGLLATACPETEVDGLLHLSIGQRDARLLVLRRLTFGDALECRMACPACGSQLELGFTTTDLLAQAGIEAAEQAPGEYHLEAEGWQLRFRLPDSLDLFDAISSADPSRARAQLLQRCVTGIAPPGGAQPAELLEGALPEAAEAALLAEMQRPDAASSFAFALICPACAHAWTAQFDILSFFWTEIQAWSHRTLRDVHLLARAYGWREADILALTGWRRHAYLQMCGHG
jgi:hypothetical protein